MIEHNAKTWGISITEFETSFKNNTIGTFKAPSSTVKNFNNFATDADKTKAFMAIANTYIDALRTTSKGKSLNKLSWDWLQKDTKDFLKEGVYGAIQHAVLNRQIWEKINTSSISTPNFSMSIDSQNWLLTNDVFGKFVHNSLTLSGVDEYEWVTEEELLTITNSTTGRIEIIGKADLEKIAELI